MEYVYIINTLATVGQALFLAIYGFDTVAITSVITSIATTTYNFYTRYDRFYRGGYVSRKIYVFPQLYSFNVDYIHACYIKKHVEKRMGNCKIDEIGLYNLKRHTIIRISGIGVPNEATLVINLEEILNANNGAFNDKNYRRSKCFEKNKFSIFDISERSDEIENNINKPFLCVYKEERKLPDFNYDSNDTKPEFRDKGEQFTMDEKIYNEIRDIHQYEREEHKFLMTTRSLSWSDWKRTPEGGKIVGKESPDKFDIEIEMVAEFIQVDPIFTPGVMGGEELFENENSLNV